MTYLRQLKKTLKLSYLRQTARRLMPFESFRSVLQNGPKNCTPKKQLVQQCVPIKLALSDLSVTLVVSRKQIIL